MHSPLLFGAIYHIDKIAWQIIFALCAIFFAPVNCDTVSQGPVGLTAESGFNPLQYGANL
jgi:hypothetical protein